MSTKGGKEKNLKKKERRKHQDIIPMNDRNPISASIYIELLLNVRIAEAQ